MLESAIQVNLFLMQYCRRLVGDLADVERIGHLLDDRPHGRTPGPAIVMAPADRSAAHVLRTTAGWS